MRDDTPTTQALDHLNSYGYTEDFLVYVTHYSPNLVQEAFKGYISFMGPTLDKLVALVELTELLDSDPKVTVHPATFIQEQVVSKVDSDGMTVMGKLWATEKVNTEQILKFAQALESITTTKILGLPDHTYNVPKQHFPINGSKAGVKQVW